MVDAILQGVLIWHAALILVLLVFAGRTAKLADRVVALDTMSSVFATALIVTGLYRRDPVYLDIALVVAMLGFVQTLASARLLERRRKMR